MFLKLSPEFQAYIAWCQDPVNMPDFDEVTAEVEEELCCPISTTLPKVPVVLFGQIFDLDSISKLVIGNIGLRELTISAQPLTMQKITDPDEQIKPLMLNVRNLISKERRKLAKPAPAPVKQANAVPAAPAAPPAPPILLAAVEVSQPVPFPSHFVDMGPPVKSPPAISALTNGLTRDQINDLLATTTNDKEKLSLSIEVYLLMGEVFLAIRQAEAYLYDVDLSKANALDKKVCKLLMHAYQRDMGVHKVEARTHALNVIHYIDNDNYEANLVYAQICVDELRNHDAITRATKFLTLFRDEETKHFKYYAMVDLEVKPEYPQQNWDNIRALEVLATAYKNLGQVENAQPYAEVIIKEYDKLHCVPDLPLRIMAWVYSQKGNYVKVLECLERSWEFSNYPEFVCLKITAFVGLNDLYKAVQWGEFALEHKHKNSKEVAHALLAVYQRAPQQYAEKAKQLSAKLYSNNFSLFADQKKAAAVQGQGERPSLKF